MSEITDGLLPLTFTESSTTPLLEIIQGPGTCTIGLRFPDEKGGAVVQFASQEDFTRWCGTMADYIRGERRAPGLPAKDGTFRPCCNTWCDAIDATFEPDPFAQDVHGDDTPVWECESCRQSSAQDI